MTEAKFTKGEWVAGIDDSYYHVMCGDHCVVTSFDDADDEANAHLIASAPDMYKVIEQIVKWQDSDGGELREYMNNSKVSFKRLLAKARGK